ncbi:MAG: transcriptional repressor [Chloroflexi bacterium]|nr:transcriptional repressor [Chloroflexota bacterium]MCL5273285.1 transcriptional repressor [Chloroflexota bacterium]
MTESGARLDHLVSVLKGRGYRLTPQRKAVLQILAASDGHLSVEQIYARVKKDFPMTSLATVYKTVTLLKEMGEVLELGFSDGGNRYDGRKPYPHPHLICIRCRKIIDPEVTALSHLPQEVASSTGYRIVNHRLDFFGICPECQAAENQAGNNSAGQAARRNSIRRW